MQTPTTFSPSVSNRSRPLDQRTSIRTAAAAHILAKARPTLQSASRSMLSAFHEFWLRDGLSLNSSRHEARRIWEAAWQQSATSIASAVSADNVGESIPNQREVVTLDLHTDFLVLLDEVGRALDSWPQHTDEFLAIVDVANRVGERDKYGVDILELIQACAEMGTSVGGTESDHLVRAREIAQRILAAIIVEPRTPEWRPRFLTTTELVKRGWNHNWIKQRLPPPKHTILRRQPSYLYAIDDVEAQEKLLPKFSNGNFSQSVEKPDPRACAEELRRARDASIDPDRGHYASFLSTLDPSISDNEFVRTLVLFTLPSIRRFPDGRFKFGWLSDFADPDLESEVINTYFHTIARTYPLFNELLDDPSVRRKAIANAKWVHNCPFQLRRPTAAELSSLAGIQALNLLKQALIVDFVTLDDRPLDLAMKARKMSHWGHYLYPVLCLRVDDILVRALSRHLPLLEQLPSLDIIDYGCRVDAHWLEGGCTWAWKRDPIAEGHASSLPSQ